MTEEKNKTKATEETKKKKKKRKTKPVAEEFYGTWHDFLDINDTEFDEDAELGV